MGAHTCAYPGTDMHAPGICTWVHIIICTRSECVSNAGRKEQASDETVLSGTQRVYFPKQVTLSKGVGDTESGHLIFTSSQMDQTEPAGQEPLFLS